MGYFGESRWALLTHGYWKGGGDRVCGWRRKGMCDRDGKTVDVRGMFDCLNSTNCWIDVNSIACIMDIS